MASVSAITSETWRIADELAAMNRPGADMLDLGDRIGTLSPGKDADLVTLSGDPFSVYTRVLETWVEGEKRSDLDDPEDRLVAEGGFNALTDNDGAGYIHGQNRHRECAGWGAKR